MPKTTLSFTHVFHLAGDQILPNYMAITATNAPWHLFLASDRTAWQKDRLVPEFPDRNVLMNTVDPFSYRASADVFNSLRPKLGAARIAVNVTGGTKLMAAAALDFCRSVGGTPIYIDTDRRKIHVLSDGESCMPLPPAIQDVASFVRLAGYHVMSEGRTPDDPTVAARSDLTRKWWRSRRSLHRFLPRFGALADGGMAMTMPDEYPRLVREMLDAAPPPFRSAWAAAFPENCHDWRESCRYAAGVWFEEFCLRRLAGTSSFRDVRMNVVAGLPGEGDNAGQELDIACTDGFSLYIVECKSGSIRQEHVQKLENNVATFGGAFGRGCLASSGDRPGPQRRRIENSRTIGMTLGQANENLAVLLPQIEAGHIVAP